MNLELYANFRADEPLPEATELLKAANTVMARQVPVAATPAPIVPQATSRMARRFHRMGANATANAQQPLAAHATQQAPVAIQTRPVAGFTRFTRGGAATRFSHIAPAPALRPRNMRMASAVLMAASNTKKPAVPAVQALDVLRARVLALKIASRLHQRFTNNALDMMDGKPDISRLVVARGRNYSNLLYA